MTEKKTRRRKDPRVPVREESGGLLPLSEGAMPKRNLHAIIGTHQHAHTRKSTSGCTWEECGHATVVIDWKRQELKCVFYKAAKEMRSQHDLTLKKIGWPPTKSNSECDAQRHFRTGERIFTAYHSVGTTERSQSERLHSSGCASTVDSALSRIDHELQQHEDCTNMFTQAVGRTKKTRTRSSKR